MRLLFAVLLVGGPHAAPLSWTDASGCRFAPVQPAPGKVGFTPMPGLSFTNRIPPERHYTNQILLNGSGVAAGDVDGDGWCDLFFAGIGGGSALHRNGGNWKFENVTKHSGLQLLEKLDATGTALADLDGDGDLDLIVNSVGQGTYCFWNDGKGGFGAQPLVLNPGRCGSSLALADIDGDGALDLYIANYRTSTIRDQPGAKFTFKTVDGRPVPVAFAGRPLTDPDLTNRFTFIYKQGASSVFHDELGEPDVLYRNQGKGQLAISPLEQSFDWGLSVMMRDFNGDGAPDIYVCNDFATPDRFWINDGKGRFKAAPAIALRQTSLSTMAIDVADINRDGFDDIFTADMLSRERWRRLVQKNESNPNMHLFVDTAQQPQSPRNTLQLARGDGTYAEIAQLAGLEAAEWAWASIFLDVDLDGYEDLLVANGFERDYMNMDANRKITALKARGGAQMAAAEHFKLNQYYPRLATPNAAFRNLGNLRFADVSAEWRFDIRAVSQGMCLADLDNDGDMDVIINNSNDAALLLRNDTPAPRVGVRLKGQAPNTRGIGAKIKLLNGRVPAQTQEIISGGRYLSSDDAMRVFAAGTNSMTIEVTWRSGVRSVFTNITPNRIYEIEEAGLPVRPPPAYAPTPMFKDVSATLHLTDTNMYVDEFARQPLLPNKLNTYGLDLTLSNDSFVGLTNASPIAVADVDGDGELETFVGCRSATNRWPESGVSQLIGKSGVRWSADMGLVRAAVFSDIDADGDSDLVVACEWGPIRVFKNDRGVFAEATAALGLTNYVGWWNGLSAGDFDGDGRMDLIAGNWGRNSKYERYRAKPVRLVYGDFNGNGAVEPMEACYDDTLQAYAPILNVWSLSRGLPWLLEKFGSYEAFGRATI
ncbi:MAG TPA: VCBS repeat-containing protein, partial [Verrucomicrobiae bacterium]|nr:VCBS repeat-containing protein [Verrucomicrobiae bacterium]